MSFERGILSFIERAELAWEGITLTAQDGWRRSAPLRAAACRQCRRTGEHPLSWSLVYVILFCALAYLTLDRPVARLFKATITGEIEGFFKIVTRLGEAEWYLVPAGILALVFLLGGWKAAAKATRDRLRRWAIAPGYLFLSIALSGLVSNAIKVSLGRYRPRYLFDDNLYGFSFFSHQWGMNSFPSGHSQAAFAAMTALCVIFPRHALLWLVIAVLVGLSRVTTTVHYLSDVVAGSWLGICGAILLARWFRAKGWNPRIGGE